MQKPDRNKIRRTRELILDQLGIKVLEWRGSLRGKLDARVFFAIEGAFRCNLFRGPVISRNPEMAGKEVIEIDYSCRVPDQIDPQDPAVIQAIETALAVKHRGNAETNGWKQPAKQSYFFGQTKVAGVDEVVELDLCVQRESETCELSDYWDRLFLPKEAQLMRRERQLAEERDRETYERTKHLQNEGAKFRLLLALATGRISPVPARIEDYVDRWYEWAMPSHPGHLAPNWVQHGWEIAQSLRTSAPTTTTPAAAPAT